MDGKLITEIREILFSRKKRIGGKIGRDEAPEDASIPQSESVDMAQMLEQIGRDISLDEQERSELRAIDLALTKLTTGQFGVCEDCGGEIPTKRLQALPEARLCADCQEMEEKQNRTRIRHLRHLNAA